jgi:hypothetical protein
MSDIERDEFYRNVRSGLLIGGVDQTSDIARGYLFFMTQPSARGRVLALDGGGVLV